MNSWYTSTPRKSSTKPNNSYRRQEVPSIQKTPIRAQISELCRNSILKNSQSKITNNLYKVFPNYTPPSKLSASAVIKNPFENPSLIKDLSSPFCSPSLFQNQTTFSLKKSEEHFSWSIEDISTFRPAKIDENPSQEFVSWYSPDTENKAQEAIKEYFSKKHKIVSPDLPATSIFNNQNSLSSSEEIPEKIVADKSCQTTLSFPASLPDHILDLLSSYMLDSNRSQNNSFLNTSNGSTKRKKLKFDEFDTNDTFMMEPKMDIASLSPQSSPIAHYKSSPYINLRISPQLSPVSCFENQSRNALNFSDVEMNSIIESIPGTAQ